MSDKPPYWFPAKRYGWGWGLPTAWQGWVVMLAWFALLLAGALWLVSSDWLVPSKRVLAFLGYVLLISGALFVVCWRTGEPPRWRWGEP